VSRTVWHQLEPVNAVAYFSPECRQAGKDLGLLGFWMGYFAARAAPMGPVSAGVVDATFYNFHPAMVRRAIPDAWHIATPEAVLSSRSESAGVALRRLAPDGDEPARRVIELLRVAIDAATSAGRPLFAANRDVEPSGDVLSRLWQAATTMREHRGDGHVATLTEADIDGCEAHVLFAATEGVDGELYRNGRGWSELDWADATARLRDRHLLGSDGQPTDVGRLLRRRIEERTDELAVGPYRALGASRTEELLAALARITTPISSTPEIAYPNPMGLPRP
jgi:hypothetical protein